MLVGAVLLVASLFAFPSAALAEFVYIDPGHGGRYGGAHYGGVSEKYVNLLIAQELQAALLARGYDVGMTRDRDVALGTWNGIAWHWDTDGVHYRDCDSRCAHDAPVDDLQARVDKANLAGADLFISIHNNAGGSSARGTETYYNADNDTDRILSGRLARYVQEEVVRSGGTVDRGVGSVGFYVVRWSNMPAVLAEVAFLSNSSDRSLLLSQSFRQSVARGIANAVDRFFGSDPYQPVYPRRQGISRWATAVDVANDGWPSASTVILSSGRAWPDSLAATPLSARLDAPVLLSEPTTLPVETAEALGRYRPSEIIVLGGPAAISATVTAQAAAAASLPLSAVRRVAGADRLATASEVATLVGVPANGRVFVVSARRYPDALSAAAKAGIDRAPILMTEKDALPEPTQRFLADNAASITEVVVVGGDGVIAPQVATLAASTAGATLTRVAGQDRYTTNVAMLRTFWPTALRMTPVVATAESFPDALVAGTLAAKRRQPIVLLGRKYLPIRTREWAMNETARIQGFTMVGGDKALAYLMDWELVKALR